MPQPLSSFPSIRQQYNIRWGYETLTERTELAQLVAQVIAVGAQIEYAQDRAVSTIVGHDNDLAFAMFASLKSPTVRKSTMSELAEDRLSGAIRTTFNVAISAYDTVSGHRNDFAHHIWGICDQLPDALLLSHPKHRVYDERRMFKYIDWLDAGNTPTDAESHMNAYTPNFNKIMVYKRPDFDDIIGRLDECAKIWGTLSFILQNRGWPMPPRARLYRWLLKTRLFYEQRRKAKRRTGGKPI